MAQADDRQCQCAKCFAQSQFVPIVLGAATLLATAFCIFVMLKFKDDADIIWAQGIMKELLAAFLVSLVGSPRPTSHQGDTIKTGDNTTVNVPKPADTTAPIAPAEEPKP